MADALQRVADGMRKIIHGIDAPLIARAPMLFIQDTIHGRIAHVHVGRGHIDLGSQRLGAFGKLACAHAAEQIQAFLDGTVAPGTVLAGGSQRAAVFAHLILVQLVHIGQAALDPVLGNFIAFIVIIAGVEQAARPVEAQPGDILLDGLHKLGVFLGRVGIVKAQVAQAAVFFGGQEVHDQRLAVTNVHIAVGFRRETGVDLLVTPALQILVNGFPDKICTFERFFHT